MAGVGAIALEAIDRFQIQAGQSVYVVGLSLVGQLAVSLLKDRGCIIFAMDVDDGRCQLAKRLGAAFSSGNLLHNEVRRLTDSRGADAALVIDCGLPSSLIDIALEAVKLGGQAVLVDLSDPRTQAGPDLDVSGQISILFSCPFAAMHRKSPMTCPSWVQPEYLATVAAHAPQWSKDVATQLDSILWSQSEYFYERSFGKQPAPLGAIVSYAAH